MNHLVTVREMEALSCEDALCSGCGFGHSRPTGAIHYYIDGREVSEAEFGAAVVKLNIPKRRVPSSNYKKQEAPKPPKEEHEIIRAYKLFGIAGQDIAGLKLCSPARGLVWQSRKMVAECPFGFFNAAQDPSGDTHSHLQEAARTHLLERNQEHRCGIYAMTPEETKHFRSYSHMAFAEVLLWGIVVEGECGYRAEHCQIERIWYIGDEARGAPEQSREVRAMQLAHFYQVPVQFGHPFLEPAELLLQNWRFYEQNKNTTITMNTTGAGDLISMPDATRVECDGVAEEITGFGDVVRNYACPKCGAMWAGRLVGEKEHPNDRRHIGAP